MNKENMQEQKMNSPLKQEIEMKWHYIKSINQSINQLGLWLWVLYFLMWASQEPDVSTSAQ